MTDYTKGPWETGEERPQGLDTTWIWIGPEGWRTRTARVVLYTGEEDEQRSNASLISAAPELFEALKGVRDRFFPENQPERDQDSMWNAVNAAIAKAEGRSK